MIVLLRFDLRYIIAVIQYKFIPMATRVTPTFLLKGLDPNKLLSDYHAGFFSRSPAAKSKIKIAQNMTILAPKYGISNHAPVFCLKDRNNCSVVVATTNHTGFEVFTRTGGQLPTGGRCMRCTQDIPGVAMGYPVGYQEVTVLTNADVNPQNARYRVLYTFWVDGRFCDFECTLAYIQSMLARPAIYRDTTIRDSERMLKLMFRLMHPTAGPLRPAQDPGLLGALTDEEWKDPRHVYVRTDRILMIPAKVEYVQQNFLNPVVAIDYARDMTTVVAST